MDPDAGRRESLLVTKGGWLSREGIFDLVLIGSTILAFAICYKLVKPFLPAITWALVLGVVGRPLHAWLLTRLKHANLAAGLSVLVIAGVIVVPGIVVVQRLATEGGRGVEAIRKVTESGQWKTTIDKHPQLARLVDRIQPFLDIRSTAAEGAETVGKIFSAFVGGSIWTAVQFLITLFTLFYLFRDRDAILASIKSIMPIPASTSNALFSRVDNAIHATIYGTFLVAVVQGVLGGFMFLWLGLPGPLFWAMVMTFFAIIPVLGAPVVWAPAAAILALTGSWGKALILTVWGVVVIGFIDNLLYPILVGDKMRMHTVLVFFAVVGGLLLFGSAGIVLGPITVVVTKLLMEVWRDRTSDGETPPNAGHKGQYIP